MCVIGKHLVPKQHAQTFNITPYKGRNKGEDYVM